MAKIRKPVHDLPGPDHDPGSGPARMAGGRGRDSSTYSGCGRGGRESIPRTEGVPHPGSGFIRMAVFHPDVAANRGGDDQIQLYPDECTAKL